MWSADERADTRKVAGGIENMKQPVEVKYETSRREKRIFIYGSRSQLEGAAMWIIKYDIAKSLV